MKRCYRPIMLRDEESVGMFKVPCGKCYACRGNKAEEMAYRLVDEKRYHKESCFVTLTYDEESVPKKEWYGYKINELRKKDVQLFMKRLRRVKNKKIRYYVVGEYGEGLLRPHYHCMLFGVRFYDLEEIYIDGKIRYTSKELSRIWKYGFNTVGDITGDSSYYVSKYMNKMDSDIVDKLDRYGLQRPFTLVSKGRGEIKGIGSRFIKDHSEEFEKRGFRYIDGYKKGIGRYYKNKILDTEEKKDRYYNRCKNYIDKNFKDTIDKINDVGYNMYDKDIIDNRKGLKALLKGKLRLKREGVL